jgi:hypothetical protein
MMNEFWFQPDIERDRELCGKIVGRIGLVS